MAQCAAPKTSDTIRESSCTARPRVSPPVKRRGTEWGFSKSRLVPKAVGLSVDSLLHCNKGNGNGGNSVRKGEKLYSALDIQYQTNTFLLP